MTLILNWLSRTLLSVGGVILILEAVLWAEWMLPRLNASMGLTRVGYPVYWLIVYWFFSPLVGIPLGVLAFVAAWQDFKPMWTSIVLVLVVFLFPFYSIAGVSIGTIGGLLVFTGALAALLANLRQKEGLDGDRTGILKS